MSRFDRLKRTGGRRVPARPSPVSPASTPAAGAQKPDPDPGAVGPSELAERRDRLARQFVELQWDLGGIAYEMAIRDHFRLDVLVAQAADLQAVDAELSEAERLLRLDEAGAAGSCPGCGALFARGAVFCWQCGNDLMEQTAGYRPADAATAAQPQGTPEVAEQPAPPPQAAPPPPDPASPPPDPQAGIVSPRDSGALSPRQDAAEPESPPTSANGSANPSVGLPPRDGGELAPR